MGEVFGLIDCNNFYVSCERVFRPDLEGKPVIVLSHRGSPVTKLIRAFSVPVAGGPAEQLPLDRAGVVFSLPADIRSRTTTFSLTLNFANATSVGRRKTFTPMTWTATP